MMSVTPKIGIIPDLLDIGTGEAAPVGEGDSFVSILAGLEPQVPPPEGDVATAARSGIVVAQDLTIKTIPKPLGANAEAGEPKQAPGDDVALRETDGVEVDTGVAALLSLPVAIAAPVVPAALSSPAAQQSPARPAEMVSSAAPPMAWNAELSIQAKATGKAPVIPSTPPALAAETLPSTKRAAAFAPVAHEDDISAPANFADDVHVKADTKVAPLLARLTGQDNPAPLHPAALPIGVRRPQSSRSAAPASPPISAAKDVVSPVPIVQAPPFASPPMVQPVAGQQDVAFAPASDAGPAPATEPADAGIEYQLDLARDGEWLDRLARDIARTAAGEGKLRFRLNPEHLGSLHVELSRGEAGTALRLTADTEVARAIIGDAQPRLVAEARAQGVRIAETHVDLGSGSQAGSGDPRRQGDAQPQAFVRTGAAAKADEPAERSAAASERYA